MSKLEAVLNRLYAQERNIEITCFFDAGWSFRLGDRINGFKEENCGYDTLTELAEAIEKGLQDS